MANPVNKWISAGKTPAKKDQRRYIVAGVAAVIAVGAAPFTYGVSLLLLLVTAAKIRNAITDKS